MHYQLYIHFPFCKRKCSYCDFCSFSKAENHIEAYCEKLQEELILIHDNYPNATLSSIFLGGGTPSIIPLEFIKKLFLCIRENFNILDDAEITTEANPGTVSEKWLTGMKELGVNRISFGVQAIQSHLLKCIERIHNVSQAEYAIELAKKVGFKNVSVDLMFGLPNQTENELLDSIKWAANQKVQHISCYSLIVEENTKLSTQIENGSIVTPNDDDAAQMQISAINMLDKLGYKQYEISNFSIQGYECKHNIGYWKGEWYIGVGLSSHSYLKEREDSLIWANRYANPVEFKEYFDLLNQNKLPRKISERITIEESMFEFVMLGLRMNEGIDKKIFEKRYKQKFDDKFQTAIDKTLKLGMGENSENIFKLTQKGSMFQNQVVMIFYN